jgi:hypothetical protein
MDKLTTRALQAQVEAAVGFFFRVCESYTDIYT